MSRRISVRSSTSIVRQKYSEEFQEMFDRRFMDWLEAEGLKLEDLKTFKRTLREMRRWGGKKFLGTKRQQQALLDKTIKEGLESPTKKVLVTVTDIRYFLGDKQITKPIIRYRSNARKVTVTIKGKKQTRYRHRSGKKKGRYIKKSEIKRWVQYRDAKTKKFIKKPKRAKEQYTYLEDVISL